MSTDNGNYNLQVPPGTKRHQQNEVTVPASATVRLEVTGTAVTVQTENAKGTTSVENKLIDELPLVVGGRMRCPYDRVRIAPQVMTSGDTEMSMGGDHDESPGGGV
jgi:hypothetical protein